MLFRSHVAVEVGRRGDGEGAEDGGEWFEEDERELYAMEGGDMAEQTDMPLAEENALFRAAKEQELKEAPDEEPPPEEEAPAGLTPAQIGELVGKALAQEEHTADGAVVDKEKAREAIMRSHDEAII